VAVPAAAPGLPGAVGPARRVPAHHVRAGGDVAPRLSAVAGRRRAGGSAGRGDGDRGGRWPGRSPAIPGRGAPADGRTARRRRGDGLRRGPAADVSVAARR
jgi:hypothetical protein